MHQTKLRSERSLRQQTTETVERFVKDQTSVARSLVRVFQEPTQLFAQHQLNADHALRVSQRKNNSVVPLRFSPTTNAVDCFHIILI